MFQIIVSFPRLADASHMKSLLLKNGFEVDAVCTTGTQVLDQANHLKQGIIICGYRLQDMLYWEVNGYLPKGFEMLLVASPSRLAECADSKIVGLGMPLRINELIDTLNLMTYRYRKQQKETVPKKRKTSDAALIESAKKILMDRNHLTEPEAYRYIQKASMDSCVSMTEMAEMIRIMM